MNRIDSLFDAINHREIQTTQYNAACILMQDQPINTTTLTRLLNELSAWNDDTFDPQEIAHRDEWFDYGLDNNDGEFIHSDTGTSRRFVSMVRQIGPVNIATFVELVEGYINGICTCWGDADCEVHILAQ